MSTPSRALGLLLSLAWALPFLRAGDDGELRGIIGKAIKAKGAEQAARYKGITMKGAGNFYGLGEGIPYTGEWHSQEDKQSRFALEIKVMDQTLTLTQVIDCDKG